MIKKVINNQGIVIKTGQFNENGSVISFVTDQGLLSCYAKNINKPKSKLRNALGLLNIVNFEITQQENFKHPILTYASCEFSSSITNLETECLKLFIIEALNKLFLYDKFKYETLKQIVKSLNSEIDTTIIALYFIRNAYNYLGNNLSFNYCANCGDADIKNFRSFNVEFGGVICHSCQNKLKTNIINENYFKILNEIETNFDKVSFDSTAYRKYSYNLFDYLTSNLYDLFDIQQRDAFNFYKQILNLEKI